MQRHPLYRAFVPVGLITFGLVYGIMGLIALQIAFSGGDDQYHASFHSALLAVARRPLGNVLLLVAVVGLVVVALWQVIEAGVGYRHLSGIRRFNRRIASVGRALLYLGVAAAALLVALEVRPGFAGFESGSGASWSSFVSWLFGFSGGRWAVCAGGLVVAGIGIGQIGRGLGRIFVDEFDGDVPRWIVALGMFSYVMLGMSLTLVGLLFSWAGVSAHPEWAGTMNHAFHFVVDQPLGRWLLVLIASGFIAFAVFCMAWSSRAFHALR
ncbi:DUF1206 domain-containing protein [Corynebacterium tapiri]|uniref:DUF1206 domain-containing protein n=1 Tax=Corynebacterium tapiri TaxID=1448266 RepID=UPI0015D59450|nr:DUF1206 domain-containing protein [Corynebacterium tapiri]